MSIWPRAKRCSATLAMRGPAPCGVRRLRASRPPDRPAGDGPQSPLATARRDDAMLAESRAFLFDQGYEAGLNIRAYTSKSRDAARAKLGLAPLNDRE